MNNRIIFKRLALLFVVSCVLMIPFYRFRVPNYDDGGVCTGEVRRLVDYFFAHTKRVSYIRIGGVTYLNVRGLPPHYLSVPGSNKILFITGEDSSLVYHVIDRFDHGSIDISGGGEVFGGNIGASGRKPGESFTDWIEHYSGNEIVLMTRTDILTVRITLDLSKRVVAESRVIK